MWRRWLGRYLVLLLFLFGDSLSLFLFLSFSLTFSLYLYLSTSIYISRPLSLTLCFSHPSPYKKRYDSFAKKDLLEWANESDNTKSKKSYIHTSIRLSIFFLLPSIYSSFSPVIFPLPTVPTHCLQSLRLRRRSTTGSGCLLGYLCDNLTVRCVCFLLCIS